MKIICIGRNYAEHVKELHNTAGGPDGLPTEPVFFLKPDTALLRNNDPFYIPSFSQEVHYECELVVRINRVGKCIEERFAHRYYDEVGLGIDFTARDLQREAIARGYATNSKFTKGKKVVNTTKRTKTIKKLKKVKTYYVRVRAYKKDSTGRKVYGKYSKVKKVKITK